MGLWSSTFGGGNSFTESVANVFTPNDGAVYSGGDLVTQDSYDNQQSNPSSSLVSVAPGTVIGDKTITGNANDANNDGTVQRDGTVTARVPGTAPEPQSAIQTGLGVLMDPLAAIPKVLGGLASWANNLDPEADGGKNVDGRMVYTRSAEGKKFEYSYNFAGMPYQVEIQGDKVVDFLTIVEDQNGNREGSAGFDASTAMSGYQRSQATFNNSGDNDGADQVAQYQQNNQAAFSSGGGGGGGLGGASASDIASMAEKAGLVKVQADMDEILANPNKFLSDRGLKLADLQPQLNSDAEGVTLDPANEAYKLGDDITIPPSTVGSTATADAAIQSATPTYESKLTAMTDAEMVQAATGVVSDNAQVDADKFTLDMTGSATGVNEDGSKNELGLALNKWASVDVSKVIDTSTTAGKLLADKLSSEGKDFVDAKASILFQMKTITAEFKGPNNEPVIPPWAAALSRDAQRSIAFSGITGTAAIATMSNAIMEATLGVAEKEASFFQTLTTKNLDNKQESIINKANVLSKIDMTNLDVRSQAAVLNAKNFMQLDLANLTNEQQAEVVNKEALVQAMFDNTKEVNSNRLFTAKTTADRDTFYSELNASIQRHNSSEQNILAKFNAGATNGAVEFNADMKNAREQFVSNMQYNIDVSNAKWRQTVETTNTALVSDAHTADVKAALDLTQEVQNNIWDSADNLLDYIWKTADADQEREMRLLMSQMQAQSATAATGNGFMDGLLTLGGAYLGTSSGSGWMTSLLGGK